MNEEIKTNVSCSSFIYNLVKNFAVTSFHREISWLQGGKTTLREIFDFIPNARGKEMYRRISPFNWREFFSPAKIYYLCTILLFRILKRGGIPIDLCKTALHSLLTYHSLLKNIFTGALHCLGDNMTMEYPVQLILWTTKVTRRNSPYRKRS